MECAPWVGVGVSPVIGGGDCDDAEDKTYPGAPESNDAKDNQCPGDPGYGVTDETSGDSGFHNPADATEYSWVTQTGATSTQVVRSSLRDFSGGCTTWTTSGTQVNDPDLPPASMPFYYLNRPLTPHVGSWGQDSAGVERTAICP